MVFFEFELNQLNLTKLIFINSAQLELNFRLTSY